MINTPCDLSMKEVESLDLIKIQNNILDQKKLGINIQYTKPIQNQNYGSFTFIKSLNAKPDELGCFGYIRLTGNFITKEECINNATKLIQKQDQLNEQRIVEVGKIYPLVEKSDLLKIEKIRVEKIQENFENGYKDFEKNELLKDGKAEMDDKIKKLKEDVTKEESVGDKYNKLVSMNAWLLENVENFKNKIKNNFKEIDILDSEGFNFDEIKFLEIIENDLKTSKNSKNDKILYFKNQKDLFGKIFNINC